MNPYDDTSAPAVFQRPDGVIPSLGAIMEGLAWLAERTDTDGALDDLTEALGWWADLAPTDYAPFRLTYDEEAAASCEG